jgi:hypothetical protein
MVVQAVSDADPGGMKYASVNLFIYGHTLCIIGVCVATAVRPSVVLDSNPFRSVSS